MTKKSELHSLKRKQVPDRFNQAAQREIIERENQHNSRDAGGSLL